MSNPIALSTVAGSATIGSDFTAPTQIIIPANDRRGCAFVSTANDNNVEPTESFTLQVTPGQPGIVVGSGGETTITIQDNDG